MTYYVLWICGKNKQGEYDSRQTTACSYAQACRLIPSLCDMFFSEVLRVEIRRNDFDEHLRANSRKEVSNDGSRTNARMYLSGGH